VTAHGQLALVAANQHQQVVAEVQTATVPPSPADLLHHLAGHLDPAEPPDQPGPLVVLAVLAVRTLVASSGETQVAMAPHRRDVARRRDVPDLNLQTRVDHSVSVLIVTAPHPVHVLTAIVGRSVSVLTMTAPHSAPVLKALSLPKVVPAPAGVQVQEMAIGRYRAHGLQAPERTAVLPKGEHGPRNQQVVDVLMTSMQASGLAGSIAPTAQISFNHPRMPTQLFWIARFVPSCARWPS
jgi:hypothetical protein